MTDRIRLTLSLTTALLMPLLLWCPLWACCGVPPSGKAVLNADQTVIIIWDAATKTEHFIRQASFKSDADDFGFLVPTPNQPELDESSNDAFALLAKLTEPERQKVQRPTEGMGCSCSKTASFAPKSAAPPPVRVLQQKLVAGFDAVVLEADSANALVNWLIDHGYAFSPEVEAWAKPYVGSGWKITALKVAKANKEEKTVAASALRMSFKTDQPVFPYREPDPKSYAQALDAKRRLLRIYFLAEARYQPEFNKERSLDTNIAWANQLKAEDAKDMLRILKLPEATGPAEWWLTEFEHDWPYSVAPADMYFAHATDQSPVKRPPIVEYVSASWPTDVMAYAIAAFVILPPVMRRFRRGRKA
jgi:hypothetical protein